MPTRSSNERELSSFKTLPAVDDKDWDAASFVDSSVFTSEPGSTIGRVRGCFKVLTLGLAWGVPVGLLVAVLLGGAAPGTTTSAPLAAARSR